MTHLFPLTTVEAQMIANPTTPPNKHLTTAEISTLFEYHVQQAKAQSIIANYSSSGFTRTPPQISYDLAAASTRRANLLALYKDSLK
jgi:hypothetical protein